MNGVVLSVEANLWHYGTNFLTARIGCKPNIMKFLKDLKELSLPILATVGGCLSMLAVLAVIVWIFTEAIIAIVNAIKN